MKRAKLRKITLEGALRFLREPKAGHCVITTSKKRQWDGVLRGGGVLLADVLGEVLKLLGGHLGEEEADRMIGVVSHGVDCSRCGVKRPENHWDWWLADGAW